MTAEARHRVAVLRTLAAADTAALEGDYDDALAWLDTIRAIGDDLPAEYRSKESRWRRAKRAGEDGGRTFTRPRAG